MDTRRAASGGGSGGRRARAVRETSLLGAGSVASGLLAYVFFALVTRALGAEAAAPVSVLWAWWGFAGAALTFPIQHWIARTVAVHAGDEGAVRRGAGRLAATVAAVAVVAGLVSWLLRDLLFRQDGVLFPLMVAAVAVGSALLGLVRGTLTARRRFALVGVGLAAENALRCVGAAVLLAAGVEDPAAYGACLVLGYVTAALWPGAFRLRSDAAAPPAAGGSLGFVGGVASGQLVSQTVLTGGPVVLALAGGRAADVTALFAALALFRAPYTFSLGLVGPLTVRLSNLVAAGEWARLARARLMAVAATLGAAAVAAPVGFWLGPPLMALVFGSDVRLDGTLTLLVAVGSAAALGNLVVTVALIARGSTAVLLRAWLGAVAVGAALFAVWGVDATERTCWTFLVVEVTAFVLLVLADRWADRRDC
ncbi:lipopolysaccharide biosynthesis protein [Nocardioides sp. GCM10027113]|uniref:lipopolysaccharide biosynthesis protein n=1 Tax=unclassified Nocardioides TaxID=2615069 RepID=UPI00361892F2